MRGKNHFSLIPLVRIQMLWFCLLYSTTYHGVTFSILYLSSQFFSIHFTVDFLMMASLNPSLKVHSLLAVSYRLITDFGVMKLFFKQWSWWLQCLSLLFFSLFEMWNVPNITLGCKKYIKVPPKGFPWLPASPFYQRVINVIFVLLELWPFVWKWKLDW